MESFQSRVICLHLLLPEPLEVVPIVHEYFLQTFGKNHPY